MAPAPRVTAKAPTVGSLLAALTLDPRYSRNRLRLPAGHHRTGSAAGSGRRPGEPARISIASAGAAGPVERMGVKGGQLQIPPPGRAGWFDAGPRPGEIGRAVIVSHVDSKHGPALFFNLLQQQRGSRIVVRDRHGGEHRFAVVRRRQIEKKPLPGSLGLRRVGAPDARPDHMRGSVLAGHRLSRQRDPLRARRLRTRRAGALLPAQTPGEPRRYRGRPCPPPPTSHSRAALRRSTSSPWTSSGLQPSEPSSRIPPGRSPTGRRPDTPGCSRG